MVQKISVEKKHTDDCSLMAWGYDPFVAEKSPYHGAYRRWSSPYPGSSPPAPILRMCT